MIAAIQIAGMPVQQVMLAGIFLLIGVGLLGWQLLQRYGRGWWMALRWRSDEQSAARGADDPAPAVCVEYAEDLLRALPGADDAFLFTCVLHGWTRDESRGAWIAQLVDDKAQQEEQQQQLQEVH